MRKEVHLIRTGDAQIGRLIWIAFDRKRQLNGDPHEGRYEVIERWQSRFGYVGKLIMYNDPIPPAEAVEVIANVQTQ